MLEIYDLSGPSEGGPSAPSAVVAEVGAQQESARTSCAHTCTHVRTHAPKNAQNVRKKGKRDKVRRDGVPSYRGSPARLSVLLAFSCYFFCPNSRASGPPAHPAEHSSRLCCGSTSSCADCGARDPGFIAARLTLPPSNEGGEEGGGG